MALGHDVTFAGQRTVLPRLTALGFPTLEVGPDTLGPRRRPLVAVDREAERVVVRDHFVGEFGAFRAEALGAVFADGVRTPWCATRWTSAPSSPPSSWASRA